MRMMKRPLASKRWTQLPVTNTMLAQVDQLQILGGRLSVRAGGHTLAELSRTVRVTNSYYSNLIEGVYARPQQIIEAIAKPRQHRANVFCQHVLTQTSFERLLKIRQRSGVSWASMLEPKLACRVHQRLFAGPWGGRPSSGKMRAQGDSRVIVGNHQAPDSRYVAPMLNSVWHAYGDVHSTQLQIVSAMAYHHRFAYAHPFTDGNGRVARLLTQLQLSYLPLCASLWSLARGVSLRQEDYYRALAKADQLEPLDATGPQAFSEAGLCYFIEFMLDVVIEQMRYIDGALDPLRTRSAIQNALRFAPELRAIKAKNHWAAALQALFTYGVMPRAEFKVFLGEPDRTASQSLAALLSAGVVAAPSYKSRDLHVSLPLWYMEELLPSLHR